MHVYLAVAVPEPAHTLLLATGALALSILTSIALSELATARLGDGIISVLVTGFCCLIPPGVMGGIGYLVAKLVRNAG